MPTLIISDALWSISLRVPDLGIVRTVDRELEVVSTKSVSVSVRVGEKSALYIEIYIKLMPLCNIL